MLKPFLLPVLVHGMFSAFLRLLLEYARMAMPLAERRGLVFPFFWARGFSPFNLILFCTASLLIVEMHKVSHQGKGKNWNYSFLFHPLYRKQNRTVLKATYVFCVKGYSQPFWFLSFGKAQIASDLFCRKYLNIYFAKDAT